MKILFYSIKEFERPFLVNKNRGKHEIRLVPEPLSSDTAILSKGYDCISIFTADDASANVLKQLKNFGVRYIAVRAAGFDNVDVEKANQLGIHVANVPEYSPYAIAEHAVALILALNRCLIQTHTQVHQHNFTLDKLIGFDLHGKTVGIIGTGRIGSVVAKIMKGFGCRILAYDVVENDELKSSYGVKYTSLLSLCSSSDIITLHTPLNQNTKYLIDRELMRLMKPGVMLINTSRGAVIKTSDLLEFLKNKSIGYCGLDVYEKEKGIFFFDHSDKPLADPILSELLDLPNVIITPHQAFATNEALENIAGTTFENIDCWNTGEEPNTELHSKIIQPQLPAS